MAKIGLPKGSGKRLKVREKSVKSQGILKWILSGNPVLVASSILAQSHTFVEIDHEIISMVIHLTSAKSFKKGCCQLQAKVCARSTG